MWGNRHAHDFIYIGEDWDRITVGNTDFLTVTNGTQSYWCPNLTNVTWTWNKLSKCNENEEKFPVELAGLTGVMYVFCFQFWGEQLIKRGCLFVGVKKKQTTR